jgi:hypothetical protein
LLETPVVAAIVDHGRGSEVVTLGELLQAATSLEVSERLSGVLTNMTSRADDRQHKNVVK